jgi:hypothetical protein
LEGLFFYWRTWGSLIPVLGILASSLLVQIANSLSCEVMFDMSVVIRIGKLSQNPVEVNLISENPFPLHRLVWLFDNYCCFAFCFISVVRMFRKENRRSLRRVLTTRVPSNKIHRTSQESQSILEEIRHWSENIISSLTLNILKYNLWNITEVSNYMKREAVLYSQTVLHVYQSAWRHVHEDGGITFFFNFGTYVQNYATHPQWHRLEILRAHRNIGWSLFNITSKASLRLSSCHRYLCRHSWFLTYIINVGHAVA